MHLGIHRSLMKRAGLFRVGLSKDIPRKKYRTGNVKLQGRCVGKWNLMPKPTSGYFLQRDYSTCSVFNVKKTRAILSQEKINKRLYAEVKRLQALPRDVAIGRLIVAQAEYSKGYAAYNRLISQAGKRVPEAPNVIAPRTIAPRVPTPRVPAPRAFIPTATRRAPMVRPKPGAFMTFNTTPKNVVRTRITPTPAVPVTPQKPGFDVAKILPLAVGAGAALLMMRG